MPLKSDNSLEERKKNSIIGKENLAYTTSETNSHQGSVRLAFDHEEIQIEKRHENSDPPSYASKASSRGSSSGSERIVDDRVVGKNNSFLYKPQEVYLKSKSNTINILNTNLNESDEKLKNDQFDSVTFKGIEAKEKYLVQKYIVAYFLISNF
jgi:hypothetical protein